MLMNLLRNVNVLLDNIIIENRYIITNQHYVTPELVIFKKMNLFILFYYIIKI